MTSVKMELKLKMVVILPPSKNVYTQAERIESVAREAVLELMKEDGFPGGFVSINKDMHIEQVLGTAEIHDERPTGDLKEEWGKLRASGGLAPPREKHPHAVMAMLDTESKANPTLCGQPPLAGDVILYHDALPKEIRVPLCPICVNDPRYRTWAMEMDICWACGSSSFSPPRSIRGVSFKGCLNCGILTPVTEEPQA